MISPEKSTNDRNKGLLIALTVQLLMANQREVLPIALLIALLITMKVLTIAIAVGTLRVHVVCPRAAFTFAATAKRALLPSV
jgi:hypothetical protein